MRSEGFLGKFSQAVKVPVLTEPPQTSQILVIKARRKPGRSTAETSNVKYAVDAAGWKELKVSGFYKRLPLKSDCPPQAPPDWSKRSSQLSGC